MYLHNMQAKKRGGMHTSFVLLIYVAIDIHSSDRSSVFLPASNDMEEECQLGVLIDKPSTSFQFRVDTVTI